MRECLCGESRYVWANEEHTKVRCANCDRLYVARQADYVYQEMRDNLFIRSVELGCTPIWTGLRWECRCPNTEHGFSQANPQISDAAMSRFAGAR